MSLEKQEDILARLRAAGITSVDYYTPFPKSFYHDLFEVKAIYLGCDPTNTKFNNRFEYAFALPDGKKYHFERFVEGHRTQLEAIELTWEQVYVQNLCQNYFREETGKNLKDWKRATEIWIPIMKEELSRFKSDIPVLLTSAFLYQVLVKGKKNLPIDFYKCKQPKPIPGSENVLERPLIPFYRNQKYNVSKWHRYRDLAKIYSS
jgi:hypothetical protein